MSNIGKNTRIGCSLVIIFSVMIYTCVKFELIVNMYSVALTGFFVYFLFRADEFSSAIIVRFEKAGT